MEFIRTNIPDVVLCKPKIYTDDRGYFFESFKKEALENFIGTKISFCQDNEAKSSKGVLRGLHYQLSPMSQSKLVRVIKGKVLDIAVDIRKKSPTYGKHVAVELSEHNKFQLFVPKGFAHGYVVLDEDTIFSYKVDNYYAAALDRGIKFDDEVLGIDWKLPTEDLIISEKDKNQPTFNKAEILD